MSQLDNDKHKNPVVIFERERERGEVLQKTESIHSPAADGRFEVGTGRWLS